MRNLLISLSISSLLFAYPSGSRVPAGNSGEPGSGTPCASCHNVTLNPTSGSVKLTLPGANIFTAGATQRWSVSVADSNSALRKGFQLTATAGSFAAVSGTTVVVTSGSKQYVSHSAAGTTWSFDWTPPANAETVTVYLAGAAASGTRSTNVYTASITLTKAAASTAKPTIDAGGVVNSASYAEGATPGAWITIYGKNLAPAGVARSWTADEIINGVLPTTLEGSSVTINGKAAAISFVSETQLNVQAPEDTSRGTVAVQVTASGGTSDAAFTVLRDAAPGLYRFPASGYKYVAAVHLDGSYAGPTGLLGSTVTTRPVQAGETVVFFGTGFGATHPTVAPGTAFYGSAPITGTSSLAIRIGGVTAEVKFAGLSAAGLYQFNVVVPIITSGEHLVEAAVLGVSVPTQQYLAVQ